MSPKEKHLHGPPYYSWDDLESPFVDKELFTHEAEDEWVTHLAALQIETPFLQAFEEQPRNGVEPQAYQGEHEGEADEVASETVDESVSERVGEPAEGESTETERLFSEDEPLALEEEACGLELEEQESKEGHFHEEEAAESADELTGEEEESFDEPVTPEEGTDTISGQDEAFVETEAPSVTEVVFPSGESLRVVTGSPEGKDEDYWDPTGSGNPLFDTGPACKDKTLTANFTVRELTTSGGVSADIARIDPKLVECLQRLREHVGKGITITSGYRSWKRNKEVYAGRTNPDATPKKPTLSQHCAGRAADVKIQGMNGLEIGKAAIDACGPNIGVGLGNTFAHIDVRGFAAAWNYGGVKDSWVDEIMQYQKKRGGSPKPSVAGAKPKPGVARPAPEPVRFAQRVLNTTEGERLADDGGLGPLTRDALERFRKRHRLGEGSVLDAKTEVALAQRALEEIAQQSLFAQPGILDAKTEQALTAFKAKHGLRSDANLDSATRAALTNALAGRPLTPTEHPRHAALMGPVTDWAKVDPKQRMLHVMELLVKEYIYPEKGAAGLVGNLWAESELVPNRIEGSKQSDRPMRARNFAGVLTDFTAEQAMNRIDAKVGPLLPGIGLAQWTRADRRAGLFQHIFQGRGLGAAILYSIDAQLDYAVTELRSRYSAVDKVLRNKDVSIDTASDEVAYNFEMPSTVWFFNEKGKITKKRPRGDPSVQNEFECRRKHSQTALLAYADAHPESLISG